MESSTTPPQVNESTPDGDRRKRTLSVAVERRGAAKPKPPEAATEDTSDRRKRNIPAAVDRRGSVVRPPAVPASDEEHSFVTAMEQYKRSNRRPFPTWSEVLEVLRALGYRKVADHEPVNQRSVAPPKG